MYSFENCYDRYAHYYESRHHVTPIDEYGTNPVPLNPYIGSQLNCLMRDNQIVQLVHNKMKSALFSQPFVIYMGNNMEKKLKDDFQKRIINERWLPALKLMHDWIAFFGIAPYMIKSMDDYFRKDSRSPYNTNDSDDDDDEDNDEYINNGRRSSKNDPKPGEFVLYTERYKALLNPPQPKLPTQSQLDAEINGLANRDRTDESNAKKKKKKNNVKSQYSLYYLYIPQFEEGFISTYKNANQEQKFLWTWNPDVLPKTYIPSDGMTDRNVSFLVHIAPSIFGEYKTPVVSSLKDYCDMNTKKVVETIAMKNALSPLVFVEKGAPPNARNKNSIEEEAARISSQFGSSAVTYTADGRITTPYGSSVSLDASRIDGTQDAGFTSFGGFNYDEMRKDTTINRNSIWINGRMKNSIEHVQETESLTETNIGKNVQYNYGGYEGGFISNLNGKIFRGNDPILYNSMSGIYPRTKALGEGEKISQIKDTNINDFIDNTPIIDLERNFETKIGYAFGFPLELITGQSKSFASNASSISGSSKDGTGSKSSSGGGGSNGSAHSNNVNARIFSIQKINEYRVLYEEFIGKIFTTCYDSEITIAKYNDMISIEEENWININKAYTIKAILTVNAPKIDSTEFYNLYSIGLVTDEELIKNVRLESGLSMEVLDDPTFMKNAKEKLKQRFDLEEKRNREHKMEMELKTAKPKDGGSLSSSSSKKKSKKETTSSSSPSSSSNKKSKRR